jgi:hypothetical protein
MDDEDQRLCIPLVLMVILALNSFNLKAIPASSLDGNPSFLKYEVYEALTANFRHIVRINNPTYGIIVGGELYVPLIRNETSRHYVILYNISSVLGQPSFLKDGSENLYACWKNVVINAKATFVAEFNYRVLSFGTRYVIDSSRVVDYDRNSDLYRRYTQAEKLIQSDNTEIVAMAKNVTDGVTSIHDKASEIYSFVISHLHFSAQEEERGALWALENGTGDCSEYSYLFAALCRAIGIPARVQAGFAFPYSSGSMEDGHMWAEYYLENYGWVPVDATWRRFDQLDSKHFSSIQSIPEVISYSNYVFNSTIGGELEDKQTVVLNPCSPDSFSDQNFARNVTRTVQKTLQTKSSLFLGKLLGASLLFSGEIEKVEQTLREIQIQMQSAIDNCCIQQSFGITLQSAEDLANISLVLAVKTLALFVGIFAVVVTLLLICIRLHLNRNEKK